MTVFKDQSGRDWFFDFNFSALKRVRKITDVDLLDPSVLQTVGRDLCKFVDVVYASCKPQADLLEITDEQFGDLLIPCFNDAVDAFFAELEVFFRRLGRTALATLIQQIVRTAKSQETDRVAMIASPEITSRMEEAARAETAKIRTTMLTELDRVIAGETASGSPESSDSTSASLTT